MKRRVANVALEIWLPIVLVAAWWYFSENSSNPFYPPLSEILQVFEDTWLFERFGTDVVPSLMRFVEGFVIAVVLGVGVGLALGLVPLARRAAAPTIDFLRSIPAVALVSVFIVLLGFGNLAKVTAIAFAAFFPILLNTIDGVRGVDPVQLDLARAYKIGFRQKIVKIILPAASPQIFAGLRISLAVALLVMAFSEMFAGTNGIGFFILFAQDTFRITEMWSGIILLGIFGYVINLIFLLVERRVMRWHRGWRATAREAGGAA
ncbi:MAG TPA: ABC transporter permease [Gaiellaceae bacterium]|nr:ABC transporter permease [Gaiellaceae bacterium]